jgi:hypothetical protein
MLIPLWVKLVIAFFGLCLAILIVLVTRAKEGEEDENGFRLIKNNKLYTDKDKPESKEPFCKLYRGDKK